MSLVVTAFPLFWMRWRILITSSVFSSPLLSIPGRFRRRLGRS